MYKGTTSIFDFDKSEGGTSKRKMFVQLSY